MRVRELCMGRAWRGPGGPEGGGKQEVAGARACVRWPARGRARTVGPGKLAEVGSCLSLF